MLLRNSLKTYDCFRKQKDAVFNTSLNSISKVLQHTNEFYAKYPTADESTMNELESFFYKLLRVSSSINPFNVINVNLKHFIFQINLWGNRCDLSITNNRMVQPSGNPFTELDSFESCILHDQSHDIWNCLKSGGKSCKIDVIMDNAGYEVFTDFVIVDFILRYDFANKVRFHCKAIPWFISDVMYRDFHWTIRQLAKSDEDVVRTFGERLQQYVDTNRIELQPTEYFWTSPYEFQSMQSIAPKLYARLEDSHLLIFKGDLNYRKLLADMNWPLGSRFADVLGVFRPTNICTLRTIKADLICELPDGKADELSQLDKVWMVTGKYGVMHFAPKIEV